MTTSGVLKRVKGVFRDLGTAEAIAKLAHRSADPAALHSLHSVLTYVTNKYGGGERPENLVKALDQYARGFRNALKNKPLVDFFFVPTYIAGRLACRLCECDVAANHAEVSNHITSAGHVIRSEAEPRRRPA